MIKFIFFNSLKRLVVILIVKLLISFPVIIYAQNGAAINTTGSTADPSAILDVSSNNAGFLLPRLSTVERNSITNPAEGLQIFNTTTKCFEAYVNNVWYSVSCQCPLPNTAASESHNSLFSGIIWNWVDVAGVTGYQWNTTNTYPGSGINIVTSATYTQNGLVCGTTYTLYVWAYNSCGYSSPIILTESTLSCNSCGYFDVTFNYQGASVTYATVAGQNNTCWLDRNLGAAQVATSNIDISGYGDFFQWGRGADGHQILSAGTTTTLSSINVPGHSNFIINGNAPIDWRSPSEDNLWQGVSGINNPCPSGWRLPTEIELDNERATWTQQNFNGAFSSPLKLPTAGYKHNNTGSHQTAGVLGLYYTSNVGVNCSRTLRLGDSNAYFECWSRARALSVRCIKD